WMAICFNPRPALFCGATRLTAGLPPAAHLLFQSAPRALLRGDLGPKAIPLYQDVSIRAPRSSAGRLCQLEFSRRHETLWVNPRPSLFCGPTPSARHDTATVTYHTISADLPIAAVPRFREPAKKHANAWRRTCLNEPRNSRDWVGTCSSRNHRMSGSVRSTG